MHSITINVSVVVRCPTTTYQKYQDIFVKHNAIMANSKEGQGHKDKYLDTNTKKNLSQEMCMCNMQNS